MQKITPFFCNVRNVIESYSNKYQSKSSHVPTFPFPSPAVVKSPLPVFPPEDYYQEYPDYAGYPPVMAPSPPTAPVEVVEEYYTPDGKLVSTAPPTLESTGSAKYVDPRLMTKY